MVARADLEVVLRATDRATPTIKSLESSIIRFVGAISASLAGLSAIAFPVAQAAAFEKELKNVQKTTGFTDDEIKLLSDDLVELSKQLTDSAADLAKIAATAGQLGIRGRDNIAAFTASVSRASTALDLTAEQAAIAGARILNIFQLDTSQLENVFATINELSNTTTANAQQLLDVISRIGPIAGLQLQQVAALGATALDLGVSPEVAGTSLVKVFSRIQSQAGKFAKELGLEIGEFIGLGAEERFRTFLDFLSRQSEVTRAELTRTLAGSGRIFSLVNKFTQDAAVGFAQFNRNIKTSNQAFLDGTSAIVEYENVSDALLNRLANLRNNFTALSLAVGENLIPELKDATADLAEFLQSDAAKNFAATLGNAFASGVRTVIDFVKALGELDINFQNVIASARVFISFKLIQLFVGLASAVALNAFRMFQFGRTIAFTVAQLLTFQRATIIQTALTAQATIGLTRFQKAAKLITTVLLGKIRLILVAVGAIAAFLFRAEILGSDLVQSIGNFFGFISDEEAKLQADRIRRINDLAKQARKASTEFRSLAQDQIAGNFDTALEIDFDAGLEEFQSELLRVQTGIVKLATGLESAQTVVDNTVGRQEAITKELQTQQFFLGQHQRELTRLENTVRSVGRGQTAVTQETRNQIQATKTQIEVDELRIAALQKQQEGIRGEVERATAAFENLQTAADGLGEGLQEELSASQIRLIRLNVELRINQDEFAKATAEVDKFSGAVGLSGQAFIDNEARVQAASSRLEAAGAAIVSTTQQINDTITDLGATEAAVPAKNIEALADVAVEALPQVRDVFQELEDSAPDAAGSTEDLRDKLVELGVSLAVLNKQKEAIGELGAAAKEAAKTAQGAFDNVNRTIRAFRGAVLDAKRTLETGLEDRVIDLRIRRRRSEFDNRITEAEQKKNDIIEDFQERIDNARNTAEEIYLGRRRDDALEAIKSEIDAVESERAALEEKALRDRFARLQERVQGFIDAAAAAAKRGDLDEALGLQKAAQTATKSLGGVIGQLQELETTDPFGNVSFKVTENEIRDLLAEFGATEASVSAAIPGINRDLRDSTKAAADVFAEVEANIEERLKDVNKEIELLRDTVPNVRAIVEAIGEAIKGTEEFAKLARLALNAQAVAAQAGGGRLDEQVDVQGIIDAQIAAIVAGQDQTSRAGAEAAALALRGIRTGFATAAAEIVANNAEISRLRREATRLDVAGDDTGAAEARSRAVILAESNRLLQRENAQRQQAILSTQVLTDAQGRHLIATDAAAAGLEANRIQLAAAQAEQRRILNDSATRAGGGSLTTDEEDKVSELGNTISNLESTIKSQEAQIRSGERVGVTGGELQGQQLSDEALARTAGALLPPPDDPRIPETGKGFYKGMLDANKEEPLVAVVGGADGAAIPATAAGLGGLNADDFGLGAAEGGHVTGPGTATSDSIPAWLSNGEYVIDAMTTRFMGSKFFAGLQALAHRGRKLRKAKLPGFASGGLVGGGLGALDQGVGESMAGFMRGSPVNITLPGGGQLGLATGVSSVEDIKRTMANEARKVGRRVRR